MLIWRVKPWVPLPCLARSIKSLCQDVQLINSRRQSQTLLCAAKGMPGPSSYPAKWAIAPKSWHESPFEGLKPGIHPPESWVAITNNVYFGIFWVQVFCFRKAKSRLRRLRPAEPRVRATPRKDRLDVIGRVYPVRAEEVSWT